ncbi:MAG: type III secretion system inner membrane ring subunit SctD [Simkaniaceae bacterium]
MNAYLIAEDGTLVGLQIKLESEETILGRDPEGASVVLEDPMVSRKHLKLTKRNQEILAENLSTVNPAALNGKPISEPVVLSIGDLIQIGGTFFKYQEVEPEEVKSSPAPHVEENEILRHFSFQGSRHARFVIKVISGPNTGAEFEMEPNETYLLGKDPNTCDILFQDLSVSREHAKLSVDDRGQIIIEDLNSRNGIIINGKPIAEPSSIAPQDIIGLGTTSFLIIDREMTRETLFSPASNIIHPNAQTTKEQEEANKQELLEQDKMSRKSWKEMIIPMKHLILAGIMLILIFLGFVSVISLFKSEPIEIVKRDESVEIRKILKNFPKVEFTFTPSSGKLFLVGHVLTDVDHQEILYLLNSLPYITTMENNVVIDEYVWEDTNALLMKNPEFRSVTLTGPSPGEFLLRGYVANGNVATDLFDFMNRNFSFLNRLQNRVVDEEILRAEIQSTLIDKGFGGVRYQFTSGELILAGSINAKEEKSFNQLTDEFKNLNGIRQVKNLVIISTASTARIDLTSKFQVTGSSKFDGLSEYVVINGRILTQGDVLDGMFITGIQPEEVLLEKDGLKFKINYNQQ